MLTIRAAKVGGKALTISFADHYGISPDVFGGLGALDPILDVDTRLFIDPGLLRRTAVPELKGAYDNVSAHFANVLRVVKQIEREGDRMWRAADRMLTFPELKGLCIGYASAGVNGSGMGPGLRHQLLSSVIDIVAAGSEDPAIFELVGAFEDNIGPDRISDMVGKLIAPELSSYTQRICANPWCCLVWLVTSCRDASRFS